MSIHMGVIYGKWRGRLTLFFRLIRLSQPGGGGGGRGEVVGVNRNSRTNDICKHNTVYYPTHINFRQQNKL